MSVEIDVQEWQAVNDIKIELNEEVSYNLSVCLSLPTADVVGFRLSIDLSC